MYTIDTNTYHIITAVPIVSINQRNSLIIDIIHKLIDTRACTGVQSILSIVDMCYYYASCTPLRANTTAMTMARRCRRTIGRSRPCAIACGTVMNIDHVQRQRNEHSHAIAQSASMVVIPGTGSDSGGDL